MQAAAQPILPLAWSAMLENVEQALAKAEAELTLPEMPAEAIEAKAIERASRWQSEFRRLEAHGQQLQQRAGQAEERTRVLEASLGQTEAALRQWLAQAEAVRTRLANQADSSL